MKIKNLIMLANNLDKEGLSKEADFLDGIINKMAIKAPEGAASSMTMGGDLYDIPVIAPLEDSSIDPDEPDTLDLDTTMFSGETGEDAPIAAPSEFALNDEDFSYLGAMLGISADKAGKWFAERLNNMIRDGALTYEQAMTFLNEVSDAITIRDADMRSEDAEDMADAEEIFDAEESLDEGFVVESDEMEI